MAQYRVCRLKWERGQYRYEIRRVDRKDEDGVYVCYHEFALALFGRTPKGFVKNTQQALRIVEKALALPVLHHIPLDDPRFVPGGYHFVEEDPRGRQ